MTPGRFRRAILTRSIASETVEVVQPEGVHVSTHDAFVAVREAV
jgi:hypothetical protein